jgi:hypothetical protein
MFSAVRSESGLMTLKTLYIFMSRSGENNTYVFTFYVVFILSRCVVMNRICENNIGGLIFCHIFPLNNLCQK